MGIIIIIFEMVFWERFDLSANKPKLYIHGKDKFATKISSMVNILALLTVSSISLGFIVDFLYGKQFAIISSQTNSVDENLNISEIPFLFSPSFTRGGFLDSSYVYFRANYIQSIGSNTTDNILPYEFCNIEKHFGKYRSLFENIDISQYYCITPGKHNLTLYGKNGDTLNGYSALGIAVGLCTNNSVYNPNPGGCQSSQTILDKLNSAVPIMKLMTVDFDLDHNSNGNPFIPYVVSEQLPISKSLFYRHFYNLEKTTYQVDNGYVFKKSIDYNLFQKGQKEMQIYVNITSGFKEGFANVSFILSTKVNFINKIYVKLQFVLSNIGGVIRSIFLFPSLLKIFFMKKIYMLELINSCYEINEKPKISTDDSPSNRIASNQTLQENDVKNKNKMTKINKSKNFMYGNTLPHKKLSGLEITKQITGLKLTFWDLISPAFHLSRRTKNNFLTYYKIETLIKTKLSIENILTGIREFDDLKGMVLTKEQIFFLKNNNKRIHLSSNLRNIFSNKQNESKSFIENSILVKINK
jgi:hypothetical protein